ncbi:hypothetical protein [Actinoplanes sp. NPDC051411]|uniref:hypothetical protein n=1 Tax=Actinoplanes sp. NPDC051411 TaxID=3155522 RepID=UPI00342343D5
MSRASNLDGKTVRRYLRAATADELLTETVPRERELDDHAAYLAGRWEQGCTNAVLLTAELRERGYRGSARTVRRLLQTWRDGAIKPTAVAAVAPKPRAVTGWIIRPAAERTDREQADLARILDRCDSLRTVDELVSDFAGMLRQLQANTWTPGSPEPRPAESHNWPVSPRAWSRTTTRSATAHLALQGTGVRRGLAAVSAGFRRAGRTTSLYLRARTAGRVLEVQW